jgi:hypothetical protein
MPVPKPRFKAARLLFQEFATAERIADNFIDLEQAVRLTVRRTSGNAA